MDEQAVIERGIQQVASSYRDIVTKLRETVEFQRVVITEQQAEIDALRRRLGIHKNPVRPEATSG